MKPTCSKQYVRTTRKLTAIFAGFAMATMMCGPAWAVYGNQTLQASASVSLTATGTTPVAVTIYWLKDGGIVDVWLLRDPRGDLQIPRRASRVVFEVDGTRGITGLVTISQGGAQLAEEQIGGTSPREVRVVFDIVP